MPVSSLNNSIQNSAEVYRLNQAKNQPRREPEPAAKPQPNGTKEIYTVNISKEAQALFEKSAENKTARAAEILEERELQKEAAVELKDEQDRRAAESRKKIDLIT